MKFMAIFSPPAMISTQKQIDALPFTVSPSVSNIVVHTQEVGESWIEFVAWYRAEPKYEVVRLSLQRLIGMRIGDFSGDAGTAGIGEVKRSRWLADINALQMKRYPQSPDNFKDVRHFYLVGHDESVEFLSEGFSWKSVRELPGW